MLKVFQLDRPWDSVGLERYSLSIVKNFDNFLYFIEHYFFNTL